MFCQVANGENVLLSARNTGGIAARRGEQAYPSQNSRGRAGTLAAFIAITRRCP